MPAPLVDPDGALAQIEGGALWGLSMALHEGTEFVKGQVKDTNLDSYTPLRMGEEPELDIEFIDSAEMPVGLGEPGTTVVAPAIGNAIYRPARRLARQSRWLRPIDVAPLN
jgi:CO/xanthine dehydrogenase Mo-binding subunit